MLLAYTYEGSSDPCFLNLIALNMVRKLYLSCYSLFNFLMISPPLPALKGYQLSFRIHKESD